jgi:hypothetical protein
VEIVGSNYDNRLQSKNNQGFWSPNRKILATVSPNNGNFNILWAMAMGSTED